MGSNRCGNSRCTYFVQIYDARKTDKMSAMNEMTENSAK